MLQQVTLLTSSVLISRMHCCLYACSELGLPHSSAPKGVKAMYPSRRIKTISTHDHAACENLHITMSTSALKQYRTELRADLADDVHIVSISGPGGCEKSFLLHNYLSHTNNNQGQC
jgi:hypothetical protein